jgi:dihydroorotase
MSSIIIKKATIVNEGRQQVADVLVKDGFIERIESQINTTADKEINAEGLYLFPGCIDDQVHFREPGLTHKGNIKSESRAAVAGGITSFMEMPNTVPNTLTQQLLHVTHWLTTRSLWEPQTITLMRLCVPMLKMFAA